MLADTVFNHTAEGGPDGPAWSWRGLGAGEWVPWSADRTVPSCPSITAAVARARLGHPRVTQFVLDMLRRWRQELGVTGFALI